MSLCRIIAWGWLAGLATTFSAEAPDLPVADFEGPDYGGWRVEGEAFGAGPAAGALPRQMAVDGFLGRALANSFHGGDASLGTLTSPPFRIERRYLRFLIGGGGYEGETCLELLVDGKVARAATGPNTKPGGRETLDWREWDVGDLRGREVVLRIADRRRGGWGHINVDHVVQTDKRLPGILHAVRREFTVEKRYLNLPVRNGAPKRLMSLHVEGRLARQFDIELAEGEPDWWAFLDLEPFRGRRAVLEVDRLPEDSKGLEAVEQADAIRGAEELYREALRPQLHFTARRGWNNDPNGLVWYDGEYHLFFQHNPYGIRWGNMHWGHAVSPDLVHWKELPIALYPDRTGTMFSGSAVVDERNTGGFPPGPHPPMVCVYTAAGGNSAESKGQPFTQCLAFSTDRGRAWTKCDGNPVLSHIAGSNRDPKVIWYPPENKWVMALYLEKNEFALLASPDLRHWERLGEVTIPDSTECPEFFEIAVDGNARDTRWVFYGGNGRYLIGRFDGRSFSPESGPHELHHGNAFYASQTYNHIPAGDGRRILVPWGRVDLPGMPFNQMMGLPVELTLRATAGGLRLFVNPVRELEVLRGPATRIAAGPLGPEDNPLREVRAELLDVELAVSPGGASEIMLNARGVEIAYDTMAQELRCQGKSGPLPMEDGRIRLRVLADRASLDLFGNRGRLYMPMGASFDAGNASWSLTAKGGAARLESLSLWPMKSAWDQGN